MPADTISATMAITMINVLVGIMPESVLRPVNTPMTNSNTIVVAPCTAQTALMMAVALVLR